jgi:hypothetical protein
VGFAGFAQAASGAKSAFDGTQLSSAAGGGEAALLHHHEARAF